MSLRDSVLGLAAMMVWSLGTLLILAAGSPPLQTQDAATDTGVAGVESSSMPNLGGWSITSNGTEAETRVGYGRIGADPGSTTPSGIAIIGYSRGGTLISEAGVPASEPVRAGRIFAEVNDPVNTGLAIANPNDAPATINFYFTDTEGVRFAEGTYVLDAGRQISKFLNQTPFNGGDTVLGTFTFTSSLPIAVIALRGLTNRDGEFLMTTLPVAPLAAPLTPFTTDTAYQGTVYFPHFADGGGWATQVILVNPTVRTITGTVEFLGQGSATTAAAPAVRTLEDGRTGSSFEYSISPNGSYRIITSNPPGGESVGSVRAIPDNGHRAPSGLVVFSFTSAGKTVLEAGVPALAAGSAFRAYVESSGTPEQAGSIRTGLAITNAADAVNTVTLEVMGLDGTLAAPPAPLTLPPSGQVSSFIDELFDSLPPNFSGVLRVASTAEVAIVGLRLRYNDRGEIKMTTTPPSDETGASTVADRFFPHIVDSAGWSTQFILYSGIAGQASGTLSYFDTEGEPWDLPTVNSVSAGVPQGGAYADLVLASAEVSSVTPTPGQSFELRVIVANQGTGASTATTLRYYRSTDATITTSDTEVGTDTVAEISAGSARGAKPIAVTAPSSPGTYYYGACVDAVTGESSATNNCSRSVPVTVSEPPPQTSPDLTVGSPSVTDSTPDTGDSFTLSATVSNDGDGSSATTTLRYYRSTDATISSSDTQVGTDAVSALSASGTSAESIDLTAPASAGRYYYGACVDTVTGESSTTNNCSSSVQVDVTEPPPPNTPDLTVYAIVAFTSPSGTPPGGSVTLNAGVRNDGDESSAATTLRFYQSTDATITTSDTEVGTDAVGGLAAGATSSESIDITAPSSPGTYYYGACVDAVAGESSTTNNCAGSVPVTVSEPPPQTSPDLTVGSPSVNDSTPDTGESFTLSATVSNDGDGSSATTTLRFYRSTDATITTSDTQVGTDAVGVLSASGTSAESISLTAPSTAATYYYGACVDAVTGESSATNNCSSSVEVTVSEPPPETSPDLTVGSPSVTDSTPDTGDGSFTLSATVSNDGDGGSATTTLRYYRSTDATISSSDTEVGTDAVGRVVGFGNECGVDQPDGAVNGGDVLLRRVRGRGDGRVQHDEQLLVVREVTVSEPPTSTRT